MDSMMMMMTDSMRRKTSWMSGRRTWPRLEARMTSGARGDSRARVRDVNVSRSSMWTWKIN